MSRRFWTFIIVTASAFGQAGEGFGGPSILSRGNRVGKNAPNGLQYFGGVSGAYDSGITPVSVDKSGNLINVDHLLGVEAQVGARGVHRWAHSAVSLNYDGSYRHYNSNTYYNGSDHVLRLDGETYISKRVMLLSRNSAGTISRALGGVAGGFLATPDQLLGVPTNEIFDNRMFFLSVDQTLIWQKTARVSFSMTGMGFFVRRQSKALVGVNGYGAKGTAAYRVSRRTTIDAAYQYLHFDYPKAFGETDINNFTVGLSRALNPGWQVSVQGGAYQVNTVGVTSVAADPATAALFGQTSVIEAFNKIVYFPTLGAHISGRYHRSSVDFAFTRGATPGNGVYLTSQNTSAGASYGYSGISRLTLSLNIGYSSLSSVGQQLGRYSFMTGGGSATYRVQRSMHVSLRYEARQSQIDQTRGYSRLGARATLSLLYSPGERPLRLWH